MVLNQLDVFALYAEDSDYFYMHCPTLPHNMSNVVQLLRCIENLGNASLLHILLYLLLLYTLKLSCIHLKCDLSMIVYDLCTHQRFIENILFNVILLSLI